MASIGQFDQNGQLNQFDTKESIVNTEQDDNFSKCYQSELQDGVFTEIEHAAFDLRNRAVTAINRQRDSLVDLHDNMRNEALESVKNARLKFNETRDKVINNIEEFSESTKQKVNQVRMNLPFVGTKK